MIKCVNLTTNSGNHFEWDNGYACEAKLLSQPQKMRWINNSKHVYVLGWNLDFKLDENVAMPYMMRFTFPF